MLSIIVLLINSHTWVQPRILLEVIWLGVIIKGKMNGSSSFPFCVFGKQAKKEEEEDQKKLIALPHFPLMSLP